MTPQPGQQKGCRTRTPRRPDIVLIPPCLGGEDAWERKAPPCTRQQSPAGECGATQSPPAAPASYPHPRLRRKSVAPERANVHRIAAGGSLGAATKKVAFAGLSTPTTG